MRFNLRKAIKKEEPIEQNRVLNFYPRLHYCALAGLMSLLLSSACNREIPVQSAAEKSRTEPRDAEGSIQVKQPEGPGKTTSAEDDVRTQRDLQQEIGPPPTAAPLEDKSAEGAQKGAAIGGSEQGAMTVSSPVAEVASSNCLWQLDGLRVSTREGAQRVRKFESLGDLNDDGREDLLVHLGQCGAWGDCRFLVLLACEASGYEALWGPEYAQSIRFDARSEGEFPELIVGDRTGSAACDAALEARFLWQEGKWEHQSTCALAGPKWKKDCPRRLQACE